MIFFFFANWFSFLIPWCDDKMMLSKLLYLHDIHYNVIGQDPNHDALFNITNILTKKQQKIFLTILYYSSMNRMSNFLIDLLRTIVNV
jgi:DNA replication protein DnaC